MDDKLTACDYNSGTLPACAPLGLSYTPMQQSVTPKYGADQALIRGTLFPGLDLPFMNIVNTKCMTDTALGELMALRFVCDELKLYLDTHSGDAEAFALLREMLALAREAHRRYVEKYGPVSFDDLESADSYTWPDGPWPWNYTKTEV